MSASVDIRQLAGRPNALAPRRGHRHVMTRYVLPGAILTAFLALLGWAARDSILPAHPVTVIPVLASRGGLVQGGSPLFQAAGWVEARPTPTIVTALAEGVVDTLLVVEGQEVKAGEPIARLIETDARLSLKESEAELALRQAGLASARDSLAAARTNFAHPVQLEAASAEADAMLAQRKTELTNIPFQLRAAEARLNLAQVDLDAKEQTPAAVPQITIQHARAELETAKAAVEELKGRMSSLKSEIAALTLKSASLRKRLDLKTDETRQLAEAEASVKGAQARVQQAEVAVEAARIRLERMTVRAPISGRVLSVAARPRMRLMGLAPHTMQESSTVATLYDPRSLQVRADVRLEDVPHVRPGQPVRIETAAVPGTSLEGATLYATSQADLQKNTLQVKVSIKASPAALRPDMLAQVTFLSPRVSSNRGMDSQPTRLLVPAQLVERVDAGARLWLADRAAGVARRQAVTLGGTIGELIEVTEGLNPSDKLIVSGRDGLRDGERVTVTGEDETLGRASSQAGDKAPPARSVEERSRGRR
jgi:HlyD family secretion protein